MIDDAALTGAGLAATLGVNAGLAGTVGALASTGFLGRAGAPWAAAARSRLKRLFVLSAGAALLASVLALWIEAAAMASVPLLAAAPAVGLLVSGTHFGQTWLGGVAALAVALLMTARGARWGPAPALPLAAFAYCRCLSSHAADQGDLSLAVLVEWLHLVSISLWVGLVIAAGWVVLSRTIGDATADRQAAATYGRRLSIAATGALGGIVATGLFNAWRTLGAAPQWWNGAYGKLLLFKLGLVALAVGLGGLNRFAELPRLRAALARPAGTDGDAERARIAFAHVLQFESLVLLCALLAAAALSATAPPT